MVWVHLGGRGHAESGSVTPAVALHASLSSSSGYGNVAPKTPAGRLFCVFYGLFGVPLCLTWISALGKFFGGRAKRLGQFLTKRGVSLVCPCTSWVLGSAGGALAGDGRMAKIQEWTEVLGQVTGGQFQGAPSPG